MTDQLNQIVDAPIVNYELGLFQSATDFTTTQVDEPTLTKLQEEFELYLIPFEGFTTEQNVVQTLNSFTGATKWSLPQISEDKDYIFMLDLKKIQPIDGLTLSAEYFRHLGDRVTTHTNYYLDIEYMGHEDWTLIVKDYELSRLFLQNKSTTTFSGVIMFSVNASYLKLTLKCKRVESDTSTPAPSVKQFVYESDFDKNGILYWLGQSGSEWVNPAETGTVKLELSHSLANTTSMKTVDVISRDFIAATFWGGSAPQHFTLDFGNEISVRPTHFTLRHGYSSDNSFMYDWQFLGSIDGVNFDVLYEQMESPFSSPFEVKTFTLHGASQFYRYFRVLQKGNYSMGNSFGEGSPFLCINGFEVYGSVGLPSGVKSTNHIVNLSASLMTLTPIYGKATTQSFVYSSDFDKNGLIYWIGSNGGTEEYKIPSTNNLVQLEISHSLYSTDMNKNNVLTRSSPVSTYWGGSKPQWFTVDLGESNQLLCTHYTLRHGYTATNSYICDWEFSGSKDGINWVVLHSQVDPPFNKGFDTKTFEIKSECKEFFRYFKVCQKENYSMGLGVQGGSPYLCIAGFEVYGERLVGIKRKETCNITEVEVIRSKRLGFCQNSEYQLKILETSCKRGAPLRLRKACLEWVKSICVGLSDKINTILDVLDLQAFILNNLVLGDNELSKETYNILLFLVNSNTVDMKRALLDTLLKLSYEAVDLFSIPENVGRYISLISSLWDDNEDKITKDCFDLILDIGSRIKKLQNPLYKVLRTKYNHFGLVLEPNVFTKPSGTVSTIDHKNVASLEPVLVISATELETAKRSLITYLEENSDSDPSEHVNEVLKLYKACENALLNVYLTKNLLRTNQPDNVVSQKVDDCVLDRLMYCAESFMKMINSFVVDESAISWNASMMTKVFSYFCVHSTSSLRATASSLLSLSSANQPNFPIFLIKKYFKKQATGKSIPRSQIYESVKYLMTREKLRFFYVDELCNFIQQALVENSKGQDFDKPFLAWIIQLLSTISKRINTAPAHQGTKCRGCNMTPIRGVRYRCANCIDYDICENCESEGHQHNQKHCYVKIPNPLPLNPTFAKFDKPLQEPLLPEHKLKFFNLAHGESNIHVDISCDNCGQENITGIRYMCLHCDDYNLCEKCEKKTDHYPHHLFLKLYHRLFQNATGSQKALVPVLLHRALYPNSVETEQQKIALTKSSLVKAPETMPQSLTQSAILNVPKEEKTIKNVEEFRQSRHLKTLFSMLHASLVQLPATSVLFYLSNRALSELSRQYTPSDVLEDVIMHEKFDDFLRRLAYADSIYSSTVIHTLEALLSDNLSDNKKDGQYNQAMSTALKRCRLALREKLVKLVLTYKEKPLSAFYLQLLLILSMKIKIKTKGSSGTVSTSTTTTYHDDSTKSSEDKKLSWRTSSAPILKKKPTLISSPEFPLDEISYVLLDGIVKNGQPNTLADARKLCVVLNLTRYTNPKHILDYENTYIIYKLALRSPESIQSIIVSDLMKFTERLLSITEFNFNNHNSDYVKGKLFNLLADGFILSCKEKNTEIYKQLVDLLRPKLNALGNNVIRLERNIDLIHNILVYATNEHTKFSVSELDNVTSLVVKLAELCQCTLDQFTDNSSLNSVLPYSLTLSKTKPIATMLLDFFMVSKVPIDKILKSSNVHLVAFSKTLYLIFQKLSRNGNMCKALIKAATKLLKANPQTGLISHILLYLLKTSDDAVCFSELGGYNFLKSQLQVTHNAPEESEVDFSFLSDIKKEDIGPDGICKLNSCCTCIEPKNQMFQSLLEGQAFTHYFNENQNSLTIVLHLNNSAILKSVKFTSVKQHSLEPPQSISVETGPSLDLMLPLGKATFTNEQSSTLTVKEPECIKYVRLKITCQPSIMNCTISGFEMLGYPSYPFPITLKGDQLREGLSLGSTLALFERFFGYPEVTTKVNHQDAMELAYQLVAIADTKYFDTVQNILTSLCSNNEELADSLMAHLLEKNTSYTSFTGKLCTFSDPQKTKVQRLVKYVFDLLTGSITTAITNRIVALLNALCYALSKFYYQGTTGNLTLTEDQTKMIFHIALTSGDGSSLQQAIIKFLACGSEENPNLMKQLLNTIENKDDIEQLMSKEKEKIFMIGIIAGKNENNAKQLLESGLLPKMVQLLYSYKVQIKNVELAAQTTERLLEFFVTISSHPLLKEWLGEQLFAVFFSVLISNANTAKSLFAIQDVFRSCQNMNIKNQERLAHLILESIDKITPSNAQVVMPMLIDLLSLDDRVALALRPKYGTFEEVNALENFSIDGVQALEMDPDTTHTGLELSEGGAIVKNTTHSSKWKTAIGKVGYTHGVHTWDVIIERTMNSSIMVGVCEKTHDLNGWIGQKATCLGWSYYGSSTGYSYHNSSFNADYGKKFNQGDTITVVLDLDAGTIGFKLNGEDLGVAYRGLGNKEVFPAVSLYDLNDSVRLLPSTSAGTKKGFEVTPKNPLYFHTSQKLLALPLSSTMLSIAESLVSSKSSDEKIPRQYKVDFEYFDTKSSKYVSITEYTTTIRDLLKKNAYNSEIIELIYRIVPDDEAIEAELQQTKTLSASKKRNYLGRIFEIFCRSKGFEKLLLLIEEDLDKKIKTKKGSKKYKEWAKWNQLLRHLMLLEQYVEGFVATSDCRPLFFKMLVEIQDLSTHESNRILQNLPPLSVSAKSNPTGCIIKVLKEILDSAKPEESSSLRGNIYDNGILTKLLSQIITLEDILPADPESKYFESDVATHKEYKKKKEEKRKSKLAKGSDGKHWAKGTGYGTSEDDHVSQSWSHDAYIKEKQAKALKLQQIVDVVTSFLKLGDSPTEIDNSVYALILQSPLAPLLESYFRNDSLLDMANSIGLYRSILALTCAVVAHDKLVPFFGKMGKNYTLYSIIEKMATTTAKISKQLSSTQKLDTTQEESENGQKDASEQDQIKLAKDISQTFNELNAKWEVYVEQHPEELQTSVVEVSVEKTPYVLALEEYQFDEMDMTASDDNYDHHYNSRINSDSSTNLGNKMKRVIQEVTSLSTSLPMHDSSSVFLRVDSDRFDIMKVIITGPENTPYDNGCFLFDIYCPATYPQDPPLVNLKTTGNGSVRFNPNLYNCGKVCLSLLGTWRGGPNEKWSEHTSTLLQVLISIQSLIFVEEPYFNEPGYENSMGTEGGNLQSRLYNETIKLGTLKWSILDQLKNPSKGFEEAIKIHFKLKRESIVKQCRAWLKEARSSSTSGHYDTMKKYTDDIYDELQKIEPFTVEETETENSTIIDEDLLRRWLSIGELQAFLPGMVPGLYVKALELNNDQVNESVNWLLDKGENYLMEHPEIFEMQKPGEDLLKENK